MGKISFEQKKEIAEHMAYSALYECVNHVMRFANQEVFECGFDEEEDKEPPCVGLPMFILVDDEGKAHEADNTERWVILSCLADEE